MFRNLSRLAPGLAVAASICVIVASALAQAPEAPPAESSKSAAAIGNFGVDLSTLKPSVKPGDDFFAYANGTWYDTFVIPEDRSSYGSFTVLDERARQQVREIIEEAAAKKPAAGVATGVGDAAVVAAGSAARSPQPVAATSEETTSIRNR